MATYDDTARRWREVMLGRKSSFLKNRRMPCDERSIYSYGTHFPIARALRDGKGDVRLWLLNGDRFSNTTSKHQATVRSALLGYGPSVIIPFGVLDEAGIIKDSIQAIEVTQDRFERVEVVKHEMPPGTEWQYEHETVENGWLNTLTYEWIDSEHSWNPPDKVDEARRFIEDEVDRLFKEWLEADPQRNKWSTEAFRERDAIHSRLGRVHGLWNYVRRQRNTGRKTLVNKRGYRTWELFDDPLSETGVGYRTSYDRHWLGESLIRAKVYQRVWIRCKTCKGTGDDGHSKFCDVLGGEGPLTEDEAKLFEFRMEGNPYWRNEQHLNRHPRVVESSRYLPSCKECAGRKKVQVSRTRWAYFLSGFDANETRPSYFFCELPRGAKPATVAEAYEALKPESVRLAEQEGREVSRQGDIFAIPMPSLDLRTLKKRGGVHIRTPRLIVPSTGEKWSESLDSGNERPVWSGPRPNLLGTNHEATEIVKVGGQTYARGTLWHRPQGRLPDHRRVTLQKGVWHLIVKNTVPVGR